MKFLAVAAAAAAAALTTGAVASPTSPTYRQVVQASLLQRTPGAIEVKLEMEANSTVVKATVTNTGKGGIKILKTGSILGNAPVEKVQISSSGGKPVTFAGPHIQVNVHHLTDSSFQEIAAGGSISVPIDVGEVYDFAGEDSSKDGRYTIESSGVLSLGDGANALVGSVPYHSNKLEATIDGGLAAASRVSFVQRRVKQQADCTDEGNRRNIAMTGLHNCATMAYYAQQWALSGDGAKMIDYFKSDDRATRNIVAGVYARVAAECSSTTAGISTYHCSDPYSYCTPGVAAYTLPDQSTTVWCDTFFKDIKYLDQTCHKGDQASTTIHETTHLKQIKGTKDYNAYGYDGIKRLTAEQNLNHADTYTYFAHSIYVGC